MTIQKQWHILLVDDDPVCRMLLKERIQMALPESTFAECNDTACVFDLLLFESHDCDIVCIDENLGKYDKGRHISKFIRDMLPSMTPLLISISSHNILFDETYDLYWTKPYPPNDIIKEDLIRELVLRSPVSLVEEALDSDEPR